MQARTVQVIYIDNRNYPGGPWAYFLATQYLPINVAFYSTLFILTFLSDLLIVCHFHEPMSFLSNHGHVSYGVAGLYGEVQEPKFHMPLWHFLSSWFSPRLVRLTPIPYHLRTTQYSSLINVAMGTLWTLQSSQPGLSLYSALPMAYGTSYYAISLGVNIVLTLLIAIRLFVYRRKASKVLPEGHGNHYLSLAAIFIESAALYSIMALAFIISYAVNNPINQIFLCLASSAQVCLSVHLVFV